MKSTEVDMKLRSKHANLADPHSLVLMLGSEHSSSANKSNMSFVLSALLSVLEEQLEVLEDEELALITRRFMRFNDNRKNRRRNNNNCFKCGKPGHFIADCPDKNKPKGGYDYKDKDKDKKKKKKYYDREKKKKRKKAKACSFITSLSDVDSDDHDDSSSSEEDDDRKAKKKGSKNINGLCFYTNKKRGGYCVMAHDAIEHKDDDSESKAEVSQTHEQLISEVNELNDCLLKQDNLIKKAARERSELKAELEKALEQIDILKSAPSVEDISECDECAVHMASLASLRTKHASLIDELDSARNALEEVKSRPMLLGVCKNCPALQSQYDDACVRIKTTTTTTTT